MSRHRFLGLVRTEPALPANASALVSGFVACPMVLQAAVLQAGQWAWQQQVYQLAYEQAQAVVRPSLLERWQAASAN
jgi:hypothetical protein